MLNKLLGNIRAVGRMLKAPINFLENKRLNPRILEPSNPSSSGFTLVELLIAVLISSILIIQIFNFFNYQQRNYTLQDQLMEMQQNLRVATDTLSRDLRTVGYGVPSAASKITLPRITTATANSITFLTNYSDVHTELASAYTSGVTTISVNLRDGFKNNKTIYITDGNKWDKATTSISGTPSGAGALTIIPVTTNLTPTPYIYPVGSTVHVVDTVTYTIDTTDKELKRDMNDGAGAQPVCNNIDYLSFKYYIENSSTPLTPLPLNATQISSVRKISILITGRTSTWEIGYTCSGNYDTGIPYPSTSPEKSYHRTNVQTDIMMRNLAF